MTRGSLFKIVPPFEDHESEFHKKRDKNKGKSSSSFIVENVSTLEKTLDKKGTGYDPET